MANESLPDKSLPSGNDKTPRQRDVEENLDIPILPSAEAYENVNQDLELLIRDLKRQIRRDLQDEIDRLQYLLTQKEIELRNKEIQLAQKEAELNALQARLTRLDELQSPKEQISPKAVPLEDDELGELTEEERELINERRISNPTGAGGLPQTRQSKFIPIDRYTYQGDKYQLEDGSELVWGGDKEGYQLAVGQGNKFTYYAVEAAYLEDDYINPSYPQFYSQTIFQKQVWYQQTPKGRVDDGIGAQYNGRVPHDLLRRMLNDRVNPALLLPTGQIIEGQDFTRAYKNWRYKYQTGTFYKSSVRDEFGKYKQYAILDFTEEKSKGNAPIFRNEQKTSSSERAAWQSTKVKSKSGKKRR